MALIMLPEVRIAFADLFEAKAIGDGEPSFGARFIIPPKSRLVKLIDDAMLAAAKDKWKDKAQGVLDKLVKDGKVCFLKEEYTDKNGEPYQGFEDAYSIGARSKTRPLIIDRDKSPLVQSDGRPYGGSYVNAQLDIWAQDNSFGRRINATLKGVQFVRDGDAFTGGAPASADAFDDLSAGVDDDENELA